jgi:D-alanyl-D-alanine carboxypeptidase
MLLRQVPAAAIEKLVSAADNDGMKLMLVSGYRSYSTQQSVYSGYVSSQGKDYANATSAQPGHSEHQTGLAADIGATSRKCQLDVCFGDTAEGKWLAANAYKYGFIVRYQKDKSNLTGYAYEPWHVRYVGNDLAAEINKTGQTLEQFFGLPAYPDYPVKPYELKSGT